MLSRNTALLSTIALVCATTAHAQVDDQAPLKAAVQKAINANPEVTARFNAYRASADAVDAARGGYYPRLDLNANGGRARDRIDGRTPESQSMTRTGASLTLTQLLWDGLATRNDVGRLSHERLARYFEVVDITEQTALEAARTYYDVLRYRRLVQLAEDNFVQHQAAYNQIQSRFKAGVGRGVDLEQAGARVALAESNLNTEISNLHDVSARYQRLVGEVPPASLPQPADFKAGLPPTANAAADEAIRRSPAISATVESLRAARVLVSVRESSYQPKLEARLRGGAGRNLDGVRDQRNDSTAEIVLNWNLFNGGADVARVRQQANLVNQAADLRDKACRDVRQTVSIAYNDTRKLVDQLTYLDRNTIAISKARDAYRQQFDIGQRSLLDLLNSENELYTALRSYANAEYDLSIAYLRTHAAIHQLAPTLGLMRPDTAPPAPEDADGWVAGDDAPGRCPAEAVPTLTMDTTALRQRAAAMTPPATPVPAPVMPQAAAPVTTVVLQRVAEWAAAWQAKDAARHLSFYAPVFKPETGTLDQWRTGRRAALSQPGPLSVTIENPRATVIDRTTVETRFRQVHRGASSTEATDKTLTWKLIDGAWLIVKEK